MKRSKKKPFALSIKEYPQTLTAITKGKRGMKSGFGDEDRAGLGLKELYLMVLQAFYNMKQEKLRQHLTSATPDLSKLRPGLFWDTDINQINGAGLLNEATKKRKHRSNGAIARRLSTRSLML